MNKEQYYFTRSESRKPNSQKFQFYLDRLGARNLIHQNNWFLLTKIKSEICPPTYDKMEEIEHLYRERGANRRKTDSGAGTKIKVGHQYREHTPKEESNLRFYKGEKREFEVSVE